MTDPVNDCEELLDQILKIAEEILGEQDEFLPFGAVMKSNGDIVHVAATTGEEQPSSNDFIDILKHGFQKDAKKKKTRATALAYDVRIGTESGGKTDAIAVNLDHVDDYSIIVYVPYKLTKKLIHFGEMQQDEGEYEIFGNSNQ